MWALSRETNNKKSQTLYKKSECLGVPELICFYGTKEVISVKRKEQHHIILKYNVLAKEVCVAMAITPSLLF